ncbi:hypothetical protein F3Y22_tig00007179pilonHSYRG00081 [Hibiscus syriacus]|uniref:DNA/RNA-binding protein Alba-like domain-containing protein n=1 Tax=Hibiscus syriacus TaxID=106335 RepID=A0A6A3CAG0_HIBSY|nr:hypothetical protein F3Y22_tig00007179pilonHSYRG00081 [Hibiscus syriacus]
MEGITEGVNNLNITDSSASNNKKNRIQVSNTKKPLFFYVNLAKRYMQQYDEVELSALGMAIATVVTIAEILKNNGLAVEKKIMTSTVDMREEYGGRPVQKAKGGIGGVLKDSNCSILASFSMGVGPGPPMLAELKAIKQGIDVFLSSEWATKGRLILESDCRKAVDWILIPISAPTFCSSLVEEIGAYLSARVLCILSREVYYIEIVLGKSEKFDELMAATAEDDYIMTGRAEILLP